MKKYININLKINNNAFDQIKKIKDTYPEFFNNPKYVFKSAQNHIVVLMKIENTITNENREYVVYKKYAKFRGNYLKCVKIFSKCSPLNCTEKISSLWCSSFEYKVNEIIFVDNYDEDINNICAPGIHYFLSVEPAFFYWEYSYGMKFAYYDNGSFIFYFDIDEIKTVSQCVNFLKRIKEYDLFSNQLEIIDKIKTKIINLKGVGEYGSGKMRQTNRRNRKNLIENVKIIHHMDKSQLKSIINRKPRKYESRNKVVLR